MSGVDWLIILGAVVLAAAVLWYFFSANSGPAVAAAKSGAAQEILIEVRGGYSPSRVKARAGVPLTLVFDRQDKSSCSEEIVVGDLGIRRFLPAFEKTRVEIPAPKAGTYEFTCGMGMLHGTLVVE